ncbi:TIGR02996 domain-containing protein [Gemmata sp. JC717]|uniref:DUF6948 domain-containing protein n=1 Tax=Gemmata algarum TaxID=2975278 RepID=UPI0021BADE22|nr:TIGR02996 domain-containing protein [Gemmata algarum]MDY3554789.1 TIGR02996 domain-containing protein [Gemmata algarum]
MTDPDEAALLRAIGAHPGEVTARLAYADWLDEHGRGIEAAWVRHEGTAPRRVTEFDGAGHAQGTAGGTGDGDGHGHGDSHGVGTSYRFGDGVGVGGGGGHGHGGGDGRGHDFRPRGSGDCGGGGDGDGDSLGNGGQSNNEPECCPLIPHEEVPMPVPGAYVIVRSRDQGCVCGEYRGHHGREVVLGKARQIYSWSGGRLTLFDFAVVPGACRLSREAPGEVVMLEACGIIPTTPEVEAFLRAHPGE